MNNLLSVQSVFSTVFYAVVAILMLLAMITIHEFGHYAVGKIFKFKINEFAIGMGPAIFKKTRKNGEIFSVRAFPLGGFCAFEGEDDDNADENAFNNKKPWQRILVLAAGATMNYLLALLVIYLSFGIYGQSVIGVKYAAVNPVSETERFYDGDKLLSLTVDGKKTNVLLTTDLIYALNGKKKGDEVGAEVLRGGKTEKVKIILNSDVDCRNITEADKTYEALGFGGAMSVIAENNSIFQTGDYILKIATDENYENGAFVNSEDDFLKVLSDKAEGDSVAFWLSRKGERVRAETVLKEGWNEVDKIDFSAVSAFFGFKKDGKAYYTFSSYTRLGFFASLIRGIEYSGKIGGTIFRSLGELITGRIGIRAMGGTVTTVVTATQVISHGFVYALEIMAFIGVNLAVFNLLPIPALDGSRIVFCIIEWIRKKPINRKVEGVIHLVGLVLILGFAVIVDILHFI